MWILTSCMLALTVVSAFKIPPRNIHAKSHTGEPHVEMEGRLTRGTTASRGQFPYQVALSFGKDFQTAMFVCSGALIGRNFVVTAAHCVEDLPHVNLHLGLTTLYDAAVSYAIDKANFIIHKQYTTKSLRNDIALIRIPSVDESESIRVVPLPQISAPYPNYTGDKAVVSGWGDTNDFGRNSLRLQYVVNPVMSNNVCVDTYQVGAFYDNNICLSSAKYASPCVGDSGNPLVLQSRGELIGVFSAGSRKCEKGLPTIFVRVTHYLHWIKKHTGISY